MSSEELLQDWLMEIHKLQEEFHKLETIEDMEWWQVRAQAAREEVENLREFIAKAA